MTLLLEKHAGKKILILTNGQSTRPETTGEHITVMTDEALSTSEIVSCDVLISFDLPEKALLYIKRLSTAKELALVILGEEDQKLLYPVEMLLGRTIIQESIPGFETVSKSDEKSKRHDKPRSQEHSKQEFKPRHREKRADDRGKKRDFKDERPRASKPSDDKKGRQWAKKDGGKSRYLGKDENGKPIFSGKSGERNHRYDGTPRSDEEKAAMNHKPKFNRDGKKPYSRSTSSDGKKHYPKREKGEYDNKKSGKVYQTKSASKPSQKTAEPKRPPRRIKINSLNQTETKT